MKKIFWVLAIATMSGLTACNNEPGKNDTKQAQADSLYDEVDADHIEGMRRGPQVEKMRQQAQAILDSISKLPAKAQEAAAPLRARIDSLIKDLDYADFAMNKWMEEFHYDTFKNDVEKRIDYLTGEKIKVQKVKEAIVGSLAKADSVLRSKF